MKHMLSVILNNDQIYQGTLILVNGRYPLRHEDPSDLIAPDRACPHILLRQNAARALIRIFDHLACGTSIALVSGYRSMEEQKNIYRSSLKENGQTFTRQFVALPGHSEHQTGLAIDLAQAQENIDFICPDFPYEGICQDFRRNAADYGFVERYAKEKESVTGIAHEPWHFRYVGTPHAKLMEENHLSLEEYMDFLKRYPPDHPLTFQSPDQMPVDIFYLPADEKTTLLRLPADAHYHISGNNADGFIVTLARSEGRTQHV